MAGKKNKKGKRSVKKRTLTTSLPPLPPRPSEGHKGDFGRVMTVAGSRGMAGAAVLTGEAAYRGGAGLVYLCVPDAIVDSVAAHQICSVIRPQEDTPDGSLSGRAVPGLEIFAGQCDATALGPGLGQNSETVRAVHELVRKIPLPVVLDADGINAMAGEVSLLRERQGALILTPHPGELARLLDMSIRRIQAARERVARSVASRLRCVMVLKGHETVVTNGLRTYVNQTGNPGMATGGSGDVLTGIIAAFLAQRMDPYDAAVLGVHIHGLAGDLAAEKYGLTSLMATDILEWLPHAIEKVRAREELTGKP
ncbi:MAG: NAD(P)H-hydrate dehydratase [Planctomycetota bacterium]